MGKIRETSSISSAAAIRRAVFSVGRAFFCSRATIVVREQLARSASSSWVKFIAVLKILRFDGLGLGGLVGLFCGPLISTSQGGTIYSMSKKDTSDEADFGDQWEREINAFLPEDAPVSVAEMRRLLGSASDLIYAGSPGEDMADEVRAWRALHLAEKSAAVAAPMIANAGLYATAKQMSIARAVRSSGFALRSGDQHTTFTVEDFREIVMGNVLLPPSEVERWINVRATQAGSHVLRFPVEGSSYVATAAFEWTSVEGDLERLWELARAISGDFGWLEAEVVGFVLTGWVPAPKNVIQFDYEGEREPIARRLTLHIDPTCTPEEVAKQYREYRKSVLSRRVRRPEARNLRLSIEDFGSRGGTWAERMQVWNDLVADENPEWVFHDSGRFTSEVLAIENGRLETPWIDSEDLFAHEISRT